MRDPLSEGGKFLRDESAHEDGHQESGRLGVGWAIGRRLACYQRSDEGVNLSVGESEAVAFVLDHIDGVNGHLISIRSQ